MISDYKFQVTDFDNQGITDLPDRPNEAGMTADQLKARFDKIPKIVMALGKLNEFIDYLASTGAAADIGATAVKAGGAETVQGILGELHTENADNTTARHTHGNKATLDELTSAAKAEYDRLVTLLSGITDIATTLENDPAKIPTSKAVLDAMIAGGAGDMLKMIYDTDNSGVVDNAEKLGGELPTYYTAEGLDATLFAASWEGAEAPYTYNLNVEGVTATSLQAVLPEISPSEDDLSELQSADLADGGQSTNTIVILARGSKPTRDIPVRITVIH